MTVAGGFLTTLAAILGFFWRQIASVRKESSDELRSVRSEMIALSKRQDDQLQTAIERIRIDLALQNNLTRDERKEMKAEMREDNRSLEDGVHRLVKETKDELRADFVRMHNEVMNALRMHPSRGT